MIKLREDYSVRLHFVFSFNGNKGVLLFFLYFTRMLFMLKLVKVV